MIDKYSAPQQLGSAAERRFHVMAKPAGSTCNLDCKYCFYLSKETLPKGPGTGQMRDEILRNKIDLKHYISEKVGLPTLKDIMAELSKPGRDPRELFEVFRFTEGVEKIEDVKPGMKLPGIVTNITAFGAFIDIGVHQDGLAHISQLSDRYIKDPNEAVKVHQKVMATVLEVDVKRKRISLTLKKTPQHQQKPAPKPQVDFHSLQQAFNKNRA